VKQTILYKVSRSHPISQIPKQNKTGLPQRTKDSPVRWSLDLNFNVCSFLGVQLPVYSAVLGLASFLVLYLCLIHLSCLADSKIYHIMREQWRQVFNQAGCTGRCSTWFAAFFANATSCPPQGRRLDIAALLSCGHSQAPSTIAIPRKHTPMMTCCKDWASFMTSAVIPKITWDKQKPMCATIPDRKLCSKDQNRPWSSGARKVPCESYILHPRHAKMPQRA
jgi:hypothetical protein